MSAWVRWWARLSVSQQVARAWIVLGTLVATLATGPAGHWPPWWVLVAILALAVGFAGLPDSSAGAGTLVAVLCWWTLSLSTGVGPMALVAAAALVSVHVAALLAASGPGSMPIDAGLLRVWVRRGALVLLATPLLLALAAAVGDDPAERDLWVLGVGAALIATVVASVAFTTGGVAGEEE
jgi:hypothetical protein